MEVAAAHGDKLQNQWLFNHSTQMLSWIFRLGELRMLQFPSGVWKNGWKSSERLQPQVGM